MGPDAYCSLSLKRSPPNDQKSRCSNQHYRIVAPPRIEAASLKNQCSLNDEPMPFLGGGLFNSICPTKRKSPFHSLVRILLTPIAALVVSLAKHGWRTI